MSTLAIDQRFWDQTARKYAADPIRDMGGYERTLVETKARFNKTDRVFEFGCGTGTTAFKLASAVQTLDCTDISAEMIAIAEEKAIAARIKNVSFRQGTLDSPLLEENDYDVVLGFNALHLMRDLSQSLQHIHRLVKPGGLFISKTPCLRDANTLIQWFIPVARMLGKAPFVGIFGQEELRLAVEKVGFEIIVQEKHGTRAPDFRSFIVARKRVKSPSLWRSDFGRVISVD